ncbi:MAG TPA: maleylpyruvate isomerase N-terminal domain-containing protein [Nitriliruptorales bacterium]|nr:maleylpyruvate isomerase N-terminal domain-containing protein [Nitriliruptorales bacterium]
MPFHPSVVADAAEQLRAHTVALLDDLDNDELERAALPGWTVADVLRHLAESDRTVVLGRRLLDFLPWVAAAQMEQRNDRALRRLRGVSRYRLRAELDAWGRRLQTIIRRAPAPLARLQVPTMFGRVTLGWFATLRLYDEWVHQDDIHRAVGRAQPDVDLQTAALLAEFHLRALPAGPLRHVDRRASVVEITFTDAPTVAGWRFDLARRQYGPDVTQRPTVHIATDVRTWSRVAADRTPWRDAERSGALTVEGWDRAAAETLLDAVRVV